MKRKPAAGVPANPQDAFRQVCYAFGVKELAALLVMKTGVLYNKCDADEDSHHQPTLRDVVRVTQATGNTLVLDSLDRMFHRAAYDVTSGHEVSDKALLELLCTVGSENGAMHAALSKALQDLRLTSDEVKAVRGEAFDLITAVLTFVHRLQGLVDE
jgi:hypothetical protein